MPKLNFKQHSKKPTVVHDTQIKSEEGITWKTPTYK